MSTGGKNTGKKLFEPSSMKPLMLSMLIMFVCYMYTSLQPKGCECKGPECTYTGCLPFAGIVGTVMLFALPFVGFFGLKTLKEWWIAHGFPLQKSRYNGPTPDYMSVFRRPETIILILIISYTLLAGVILWQGVQMTQVQTRFYEKGVYFDSSGMLHLPMTYSCPGQTTSLTIEQIYGNNTVLVHDSK